MTTAIAEVTSGKASNLALMIGVDRLPAHDIFAEARNWKAGPAVALATVADPFLTHHWLNQAVARTHEKLTVPAIAPDWQPRELAGVAA